jgi:hypothetical protein
MRIGNRKRIALCIAALSAILPQIANATWYICTPKQFFSWGIESSALKSFEPTNDITNWKLYLDDEKGFFGGTPPALGMRILQKLQKDNDLVGVEEATTGTSTATQEIRIRRLKDGSLAFRYINDMSVQTGLCETSTTRPLIK